MITRMKKLVKVVSNKKEFDENRIIAQVSTVGILGNVVLSGFKLYAGIVGKSCAMLSDAIHSLSDVFATLIAFIGVKISKKAADKAHPYGHERIECVASLLLGLILFFTGIGIGKIGFENIIFKNHEVLVIPKMLALIAAIVSILTKEAMFWYTRYYAKLLDSAAFMADAWHHRSDAFSSIGSLIGIAGAMLGFPVLDSVASVVICLFILKVSYSISKDALSKMLDTSCGDDYEKKLIAYIEKQDDVVCVDVLHTRMFGNKVYIDLEIEVDGSKSLREAHKIAEHVHHNVETHFKNIKHVMIHLNPAEE